MFEFLLSMLLELRRLYGIILLFFGSNNTDGTTKGYLELTARGEIFRDNNVDVVGCFNQNLNIYLLLSVQSSLGSSMQLR
jgi:hypothetical protein